MKTERNIWILRAGTAVLFFGAWEAAQQAGLIDSLFFSSPSLIMRRLISMIADGSIWPHISASATVISLGFALAVVIGIPIGLVMGKSKVVGGTLERDGPHVNLGRGRPDGK